MPWLLHPRGKSPWYALKTNLGELESWSGRFGEEKNLFPKPGFEPQIIQFIAQSLY
jgi:hypothetical protein